MFFNGGCISSSTRYSREKVCTLIYSRLNLLYFFVLTSIWTQKAFQGMSKKHNNSKFCLKTSIFTRISPILVYFDSKKHLISAERLPFTSSYICSMLFTLYAALGIKSYLLTIVAAGVQCVALTYFTLSYIPGGQTAIKFMAKMFYAIFSRCFKSITNV